ncbi:RICIN domain-containing protein [Paenibacillus larvae]|uniref:GlcNAc-binding protein A n=1 Tax=Paenibacillus larvae subsp. larvae TaxID=147375 RepID=A0A6C0QQI2_9BACL|nr:RICIN domain-containing protein [Paenibacillus larvae]QHZ50943.1 GlcNAc-binding protein A [Paenibacillus larvae subsp. larvae]
MNRTLTTQDECTKIIVKFKDQVLQSTPLVLEEGNILTQGHDDFFSSFSDLTFERLIFTVSPEDMIQDLKTYNLPEDLSLFRYYSVPVSKDQGDPQSIVDSLKQSPLVETAYIEPNAIEFDVSDSVAAMEDLTKHGDIYAQPNRNPLFQKQTYLKPAPLGIDAQYSWNILGGEGEGVTLVDMQLGGWLLDHEDLVDQQIGLVAGSTNNPLGKTHHGTATLGEVFGFDNEVGIIGISTKAQAKVTSNIRANGKASPADAIVSAAKEMNPGDVLVLTWGYIVNSKGLPAEYVQAVFDAIKFATDKGITVAEAGGNDKVDLDEVAVGGKYVFNRKSPDFKDSGAIMVGAGSSDTSHNRVWFSNYGSRIDVYAWGENITTTYSKDGDPSIKNLYTFGFNGTSGATPIIAGAAVNLQGIAKANLGKPFTPKEVRDLLSDPNTGTPSNNPSSDKIGVMPDLKAILNKLGFKKELLTPPTELQATDIQANSITLQWNPSTSNIGIDIKGYYIYCNGTLRAASLSPEFIDRQVEPNTEYRYIVTAEDINKNVSDPSSEIKVRTKDLNEVQIVTALDEIKVVDKNGDNEVTLYSSHGGANQRWEFVYDQDKDAYQIKSVSDKNLVLAWNAIPNSKQVFATPNQYKEEHYWLLEATGDGYYIVKNKKNPNLVLDVADSKTANGSEIIVYKQNNGKNQKFKLRKV